VTRVAQPDPRPSRPRRAGALLLAFAVVGGPAAWVIHLLAGYGFEEAACSPGGSGEPALRENDVTVIAVLTVALAAVAVAAAAAGYLVRRRAGPDAGDARGHVRFLALAGLIGSSLFALIIVLVGYALTALSGCRT
jgi:hypothetical protein